MPVPFPPSPGRCMWMYKPGYQCPDAAVWAQPSLDANGRFEYTMFCEAHRELFEERCAPVLEEVAKSIGIPPEIYTKRWQRIEGEPTQAGK